MAKAMARDQRVRLWAVRWAKAETTAGGEWGAKWEAESYNKEREGNVEQQRLLREKGEIDGGRGGRKGNLTLSEIHHFAKGIKGIALVFLFDSSRVWVFFKFLWHTQTRKLIFLRNDLKPR